MKQHSKRTYFRPYKPSLRLCSEQVWRIKLTIVVTWVFITQGNFCSCSLHKNGYFKPVSWQAPSTPMIALLQHILYLSFNWGDFLVNVIFLFVTLWVFINYVTACCSDKDRHSNVNTSIPPRIDKLYSFLHTTQENLSFPVQSTKLLWYLQFFGNCHWNTLIHRTSHFVEEKQESQKGQSYFSFSRVEQPKQIQMPLFQNGCLQHTHLADPSPVPFECNRTAYTWPITHFRVHIRHQ